MIFKIKDNMDLKQLEKFGFEEGKGEWSKFIDSFLDADELIIRENRIITNWTCVETYNDSYAGEQEINKYTKFKIKDLIEAGLVEEVEE